MENPIKMDDLGVPLFSETPSWWMNMTFAYFRVGQLGQGDTIARPLKQVGPGESCMRKVTKMRKVLMYHWDLGGFI